MLTKTYGLSSAFLKLKFFHIFNWKERKIMQRNKSEKVVGKLSPDHVFVQTSYDFIVFERSKQFFRSNLFRRLLQRCLWCKTTKAQIALKAARCHILFRHVFWALHCVLEVMMLVSIDISEKLNSMQKTLAKGMWQFGFRRRFPLLSRIATRYLNLFYVCIFNKGLDIF